MCGRSDDIWYFAYGSNLSAVDEKRGGRGKIREAVPCRLPGYRLTFTKFGRDGTCKANVSRDPDAEVWGVAYLCDVEAMAALDRREGVGDGHYEHLTVTVDTGSEVLEAVTYTACSDYVCEEGPPTQEYAESIIVGARRHELPEAYIRSLERHIDGLSKQ